ncbi:hypothetical protein [Sphingomonas trueperi]|uniref:hypothetical protein n=1 Tax=Sphingomonas trueperi TaxID=53317 RepID=UPI000EB2A6F8
MSFGGDPTAWLDLIDSQVPDILRLILSAWDEMPPLSPDALEDPTTEALCRALRKNRTSASLPFRIDIQMVELDPAVGQDQGRMDIAFSPMVPHEAFYFCLECKRLNVTLMGRRRTLGTEYVTQGMSRFVNRQYGDQVRHGGMLGYVLDSRVDLAITSVQTAIRGRRQDLKIAEEGGLRQSSVLPEAENVFETAHVRDEAVPHFLLQHIFAAAT